MNELITNKNRLKFIMYRIIYINTTDIKNITFTNF